MTHVVAFCRYAKDPVARTFRKEGPSHSFSSTHRHNGTFAAEIPGSRLPSPSGSLQAYRRRGSGHVPQAEGVFVQRHHLPGPRVRVPQDPAQPHSHTARRVLKGLALPVLPLLRQMIAGRKEQGSCRDRIELYSICSKTLCREGEAGADCLRPLIAQR